MKNLSWSRQLQIANENHTIARRGSYALPGGEVVKLYCTGKTLAAETVLLYDDTLTEQQRQTPFTIAENTYPTDTISCILKLREEGISGEILALNFANAQVPGGAYLLGGTAQEESLCRCSLLFYAIRPHHEYYLRHWARFTPFASHRMLMSNAVPVIRSMDGSLLTEPTVCTFLTCAAVNRREAKLFFASEKRIANTMEERINRIVCAIAKRKPQVAVLGAFGCGAFGNRREIVLPLIEQAVNRYLPDDVRIVFAQP
ncbi:MAG: TIGR02452 family protein [Oscillospiraceae bacterium]|nr:TIGR02452 family protein [Oscillospiraceae bacterium]